VAAVVDVVSGASVVVGACVVVVVGASVVVGACVVVVVGAWVVVVVGSARTVAELATTIAVAATNSDAILV
jgi:hypothetical protein